VRAYTAIRPDPRLYELVGCVFVMEMGSCVCWQR
jgi:hypothetical protein